MRSLPLELAEALDDPVVKTLMRLAQGRAKVPIPARGARRLIIRSISKKQRPRRKSRAEIGSPSPGPRASEDP